MLLDLLFLSMISPRYISLHELSPSHLLYSDIKFKYSPIKQKNLFLCLSVHNLERDRETDYF